MYSPQPAGHVHPRIATDVASSFVDGSFLLLWWKCWSPLIKAASALASVGQRPRVKKVNGFLWLVLLRQLRRKVNRIKDGRSHDPLCDLRLSLQDLFSLGTPKVPQTPWLLMVSAFTATWQMGLHQWCYGIIPEKAPDWYPTSHGSKSLAFGHATLFCTDGNLL